MADKLTCFIIMPITTPEHMVAEYRDGKEHFHHVLEYLFKPAVEKAGYKAIPPIETMELSLFNENIVNNLKTADLVLCDMSIMDIIVLSECSVAKID